MQLIIVNILVIVLSWLLKTDLIFLSILGLSQVVICSFALYKNSPIKLPVGLFYLILIYLFHSGFALLFLQGHQLSDFSQGYYSVSDYGKAQIYTEMSVFLFTLGYTRKFKLNIISKAKEIVNVQGKYFVAFFLLCLPLYIASIYIKIDIAKESGYLATFKVTSMPLFHYGSMFINSCVPMATLLFVFYKKNTVVCRNLAILMFLLSVYSMASGQRILAITSILSLGLIYFNVVSTINKKNFVIISSIAVFFLIFLPLVTSLRKYGLVDAEHLSEAYQDMRTESEEGSLYGFVREFGDTVISLIFPIRHTGISEPYGFGLTYLLAPLSLSPKLPIDLVESDFYRDAMYFITKYPEAKFINFGGSILGESFANYGWFGCVVIFFVGLLNKLIDNSIYLAKKGYISYPKILLIFIIPNLLKWIRDAFSCVIGFTFIVLYLLWLFSLNKKKAA